MELEIIQGLDWIDPKIKWLAIEAELRHETGHGIPTRNVKRDGIWKKEKVYGTPKELFTFFLDAYYRGLTPDFALNYLLRVGESLTIWGEGANAKVLATKQLTYLNEYYEGEFPNNNFTAVCEMSRKGITGVVNKRFSIGEAKRAGLWDDRVSSVQDPDFYKHAKPVKGSRNFASFWYKYPYRMLEARAWSFAARKLFSDALGGLYTVEEMAGSEDFSEDVEDTAETKAHVIPTKSSQHSTTIREETPKHDKIFTEPIYNKEAQLKKQFLKDIRLTDAYTKANVDCLNKKGFPLTSDRKFLGSLYEKFNKQLDGDIEDFNFIEFAEKYIKLED